MQAFIGSLNAAAVVWCDRMWAVLWQSTFLAAGVALVAALFLRRSSLSVRYWIWQIVALKLLLMPFWVYAFPLPQFGTSRPVESTTAVSETMAHGDAVPPTDPAPALAGAEPVFNDFRPALRDGSPPPTALPKILWPSWLFCGWVAIVVAQAARLIRQRNRLSRLLRESTPANEALAGRIREQSGRMGLRQVPQIVLTDRSGSPFVCGVRRPVVVLPREMAESLTTIELQHVLLHELAHVRRRDLVWGWIGELARVVYFFHPVVHWVCYRLRLERELACDKLAMSLSGHDAGEYAATLVRVISHSSEPSVFKTAAASAGLDGESQ